MKFVSTNSDPKHNMSELPLNEDACASALTVQLCDNCQIEFTFVIGEVGDRRKDARDICSSHILVQESALGMQSKICKFH